MFDELAQQGPTPGEQALALVARAIRTSWSRILLGLGCLGIGVTGLGGSWAAWAVGPEPCMEIRHAQFTIDELIVTTDKVRAYESEPEGELVLSGREVSFVLADGLKFPVWIETRGDELFVQAALPQEELCYNVEFQGQVVVGDGHAEVVPSSLTVGRLDVSPVVKGRPFAASAEDIESDLAKRLLEQMVTMRVSGDQVHVAVRDPRSLRGAK